jgi:NADH:ubiquinone oxidoreductase subunit E
VAGIDTSQINAELEDFTSEQLAQVDEIISGYKGKPGALIPVLEQVQDVCGYLPMAIQLPKGKHVIRVCLGTACYVRGGKRILEKLSDILQIEPGECTEDRLFSLETVRCLGACGLAPVVVIDDDTHGQIKPAKLDSLLAQYD